MVICGSFRFDYLFFIFLYDTEKNTIFIKQLRGLNTTPTESDYLSIIFSIIYHRKIRDDNNIYIMSKRVPYALNMGHIINPKYGVYRDYIKKCPYHIVIFRNSNKIYFIKKLLNLL